VAARAQAVLLGRRRRGRLGTGCPNEAHKVIAGA
jgi:hypothetical protein